MGAPKLSICIPTYNQIQFIDKAVTSALNQQFDDLEVVVSDNHCTDGTSEYLRDLHDGRLRVVQPAEHVEVAVNHNFCAEQSRGRYLTFLASDNVLLPTYAARMTDRLTHEPGAAFAYCAAEFIDGQDRRIRLERHVGGSRRRSGDDALVRFFRGSRCTFDGLLMRRECYEASGGLGIPRGGAFF
jgi:glycosyltransferase involved in cell wall biosynthesis